MLAKRRALRLGNAPVVKTPLLLPSFSSKGFPNVAKILETMKETISDEVLVSAYDLHFRELKPPFDFATTIFLDSGGYEASKDTELSETFEGEHVAKTWNPKLHADVISKWKSISPTVFVSFDHPKFRLSIQNQIARAKELKLPKGDHGKAFLIKPESENSKRVHLEALIPFIKRMSGFSVIGVTEKEVGNSLLNRMLNVARLRQELDRHHTDLPIHVFGSLDTISTYLYFLAGADIFDGLTWLRYAFSGDDTIYRHAYGILNLPINTNSDIVEGRCWTNNYQRMQEMRLNMIKFLADQHFGHFGKHATLIKSAFETMNAELAGG